MTDKFNGLSDADIRRQIAESKQDRPYDWFERWEADLELTGRAGHRAWLSTQRTSSWLGSEGSEVSGIIAPQNVGTKFNGREMQAELRVWQERGYQEITQGRDWLATSSSHRQGLTKLIDADSLFVSQQTGAWLKYQVKKDSLLIHGWHGTTESEKRAAVQVLISHANESWGAQCALFGSENFKRRAWEEAFRQGVTITNYTPPADIVEQIKSNIAYQRQQAGNPINELDLPNYARGGFSSLEDMRRAGHIREPGRPAPVEFQLKPPEPVY
ncbi:MAG: LPD7 domain-containing protein [Alphaproteobacteria bacterium]